MWSNLTPNPQNLTPNKKQKAQPNKWLSFFNDYIKKGITLSLHSQHLSHAFLLERRKKQSHSHG
jgi:hypothetical protein